MQIETVEDLANQVADWCGVYGTCKAAQRGEDCNAASIMCCRVGFMMEFENRLRRAVENEQQLATIQLRHAELISPLPPLPGIKEPIKRPNSWEEVEKRHT